MDLGFVRAFPTLEEPCGLFRTPNSILISRLAPQWSPLLMSFVHDAENRILATSFDEPTREAVISLTPQCCQQCLAADGRSSATVDMVRPPHGQFAPVPPKW
jgi:hypothetical protein